MSEEKEYTIKDIADELGVSKSAISQKLTNEFRSKFTSKKKINGRITVVINEKGVEFLRNHSKKKKGSSNKNNDVIEVLKQQLKKKDEQIEKLQILLNQSQQLQLKQDEKIKLLETKSKKHWWQKLFG